MNYLETRGVLRWGDRQAVTILPSPGITYVLDAIGGVCAFYDISNARYRVQSCRHGWHVLCESIKSKYQCSLEFSDIKKNSLTATKLDR